MGRGGKRKEAGRKASLNKKIKGDLYIETTTIHQNGSIKYAKPKLTNFKKIKERVENARDRCSKMNKKENIIDEESNEEKVDE